MEKHITKREKLFCCLYTASGNVGEAAKKAGYNAEPEQTGRLLLQCAHIQQELANCYKTYRQELKHLALKGYERLAFGSIANAVRLIYAENPAELNLEEMDLFCISEIKRKDNQVEVKFFNRLEAMEKLLLAEETKEETTIPFYQALQQGVAALNQKPKGCDNGI